MVGGEVGVLDGNGTQVIRQGDIKTGVDEQIPGSNWVWSKMGWIGFTDRQRRSYYGAHEE